METKNILVRSLAVVVFASVIWTVTAQQKVSECCTKVSTAKVKDPIISFRLQRESLPCLKAVIFETEQGQFCSDPRQPWVQRKVRQFFNDQKSQRTTSTPPSSTSDYTRVGGSTQTPDSS